MEIAHNINNALGPGTANACKVQRWFRKFCKGDGALRMRSVVAAIGS